MMPFSNVHFQLILQQTQFEKKMTKVLTGKKTLTKHNLHLLDKNAYKD
jgi:hypothetical protein